MKMRLAEVRLREANPPDARQVAQIHASAMPTAFLSQLGVRFLTELYRALATSPFSRCVVAGPRRTV